MATGRQCALALILSVALLSTYRMVPRDRAGPLWDHEGSCPARDCRSPLKVKRWWAGTGT